MSTESRNFVYKTQNTEKTGTDFILSLPEYCPGLVQFHIRILNWVKVENFTVAVLVGVLGKF